MIRQRNFSSFIVSKTLIREYIETYPSGKIICISTVYYFALADDLRIDRSSDPDMSFSY